MFIHGVANRKMNNRKSITFFLLIFSSQLREEEDKWTKNIVHQIIDKKLTKRMELAWREYANFQGHIFNAEDHEW